MATKTKAKSGPSVPNGYIDVLEELKSKIKAAQSRAYVAVNRELISVYWEIGKTIHTQQQTASWGDSVVDQLAADLQAHFPGTKGFSARNLWNMRDFYVSYFQQEKLQTLSAEISWSHNLAILEKCKDPLEREFYIRMSRRSGWSYRVLLNQISGKAYERMLVNQTSFENLPKKMIPEAKIAVKDEYLFPFLELGNDHNEQQLEKAITSKMEDFLREMGNVYAFLGSQYRLEVGDQEFFIDLLLYHRRLKSLVAIELKIGEFIPEYIGKMQFYLAVLDDRVRLKGENPSIGIILCKKKNEIIVEYALKETKKPIGVSSYQIVTKLPKELQHELPTAAQISRLIGYID